MMLRILEVSAAIARAQSAFRAQLEDESEAPVLRKVGWQGGGDELPTHWHPEGRFWVAFVQKPNRFWNAFGLQRPTETPGSLTLTVEVNPPRLGLDRGIGGAFAEDDDGRLYLLHRGSIGGGAKGVGKVAFLEWVHDELELVTDGDRESPVLVLAELGAEGLGRQLATLLDKVSTFKAMTAEGLIAPTTPRQRFRFRPEFEGTAEVPPAVRRSARFRHGSIVRALRTALTALGKRGFNDALRDLFIPARGTKRPILFEAKTKGDRQNIYTAVGQLWLHTDPDESWHRVAVLPSNTAEDLKAKLEARGIRVLLYRWRTPDPEFIGLEELLRALHSA